MTGLQQSLLAALLLAALAGIGLAAALWKNADHWPNDRKRRMSLAVIGLLAAVMLLGICSAFVRWR